jgi:tetratricopeptide (TPR) repeat protein
MDQANAEIAYQRVTTAALGGTLDEAVAAQQRLFSTPRSTSYIPPGRVLLSMAQSSNAAKSLQGTARAQAFYQAGRAAWDLGYPRQAVAYMDSSLIADPEHFEALIWSTHYAFQSGQYAVARRYLTTLNRLEPGNAIVLRFNEIDEVAAALRSTMDPQARGRLFLSLSREYEKIGLPEEAFDMADRAWQELPVPARVRTAEILETMGKPLAAKKYQEKF